MTDNRDFDLRNIPGIEEMLASGVPESLGLSARIEDLERERDEARKTARQLFCLFRRELDVPNWLEHNPWLKEEPGSEEQG